MALFHQAVQAFCCQSCNNLLRWRAKKTVSDLLRQLVTSLMQLSTSLQVAYNPLYTCVTTLMTPPTTSTVQYQITITWLFLPLPYVFLTSVQDVQQDRRMLVSVLLLLASSLSWWCILQVGPLQVVAYVFHCEDNPEVPQQVILDTELLQESSSPTAKHHKPN